MIHNKILEKQAAFETETGKKAKNVYLGRDDMRELMQWAERNGYVYDAKKEKIEGGSSPEMYGLLCFEVNADRHITCA